jgi:hypothetical protein
MGARRKKMPNVAGYDVVRDEPIVLGDGTFPLGFDQTINVGIRSVLSYMVYPGPAGITFKISILNPNTNDIQILPSTSLPAQASHARQEVIAANVLQKIGSKLRIQVTAGSGSFSDIVLFFQSSI